MGFNCESTHFGGKVVETLYPMNELDAYNGEELKKHAESIYGGVDAVIISFSKVGYLNSSGLRELIQILKVSKTLNKKLFLTAVNSEIMKIFTSTNLNRLFQIYDTNDEAMRSLV